MMRGQTTDHAACPEVALECQIVVESADHRSTGSRLLNANRGLAPCAKLWRQVISQDTCLKLTHMHDPPAFAGLAVTVDRQR